MLDSGSSSSVCQDSVVSDDVEIKESNLEISTMTGGQLEILGSVKGNAHKGAATLGRSTRVHVTSSDLHGFDVVLGSDWLNANKVVLDFRSRVMVVGQHVVPFVATRGINASMCLKQKQVRDDEENKSPSMYDGSTSTRIYVGETVTVPALHCHVLKITVPEKVVETWLTPRDVLITSPDPVLAGKGVAIGGALVRMSAAQRTAKIWVMNASEQDIRLSSGNTLAFAAVFPLAGVEPWARMNPGRMTGNKGRESLSPNPERAVGGEDPRGDDPQPREEGDRDRSRVPQVAGASSLQATGDGPDTTPARCHRCLRPQARCMTMAGQRKPPSRISDSEYREMVTDLVSRSECPDVDRKNLWDILWKHRRVLARDYIDVGLCTAYEPGIPLDKKEPIYTAQYPVPHKMRGDMCGQTQELYEAGIVAPSTSPYNSPTLMVPKADGGWRMVVDFRRLNQHVITDPHPLPRIQNILEDLGGSMYFTAIDLLAGFYNLKIRAEDRHKTAFSTPDGHWEFIRLPMGLKNSPSIFQRLMNIVLTGCLGVYSYIYVDDVIVFSKTAADHLKHLDDVLGRLEKVGLKIKASKTQVFRTSLKYLGFIVGREGLRINPKKLEAILNFPRPSNVKAVQGFLGLTGYFRTFIMGYASVAKPLYDLLKQDTPWKWGKAQEEAFETLKVRMTQAPVLAFPDFSKPFILTTDASATALGAVLTQESGKKQRLISCASRLLKGPELRYNNTDRETLAAVYGIKAHRSYLWGYKFILRTDHMALKHLNNNTKDNARAMKWHLEVSEYSFVLEHKKGTSIPHADVLSRYPPPEKKKSVMAYLSPSLQSTELVPVLTPEKWVSEIASLKTGERPTGDDIYLNEGVYWKKVPGEDPTLWVPPNQRKHVLKVFHEPPAVGHPGVDRMLYSMKKEVFWAGMKKDIEIFVKTCEKCQRYKHHRQAIPWLSTPIPLKPFEDVSIDIVGPVPSSRRGNREILVIQDRLTRWIEFIPLSDMTAQTVARAFLNSWICRYGVPKRLISDRGSQFLSALFGQMCKFLGIANFTTTAYRPSSNGQNERSHRELHSYIAMYVNSASFDAWDTILQQAAWVHNSSKHEALHASPFELVTGLKPRTLQNAMNLSREELQNFSKFYGMDAKKLEEIREQAILAIRKGQEQMMTRLNVNKRLPSYNVGDLVYVRSHDYSTFIARKWSPKFIGPYRVTEILNPLVIRIQHLEFPEWTNSVHIAFVRPAIPRSKSPPPTASVIPNPLEEFDDDELFEQAALMDKGLLDESGNEVDEEKRPPNSPIIPRRSPRLADKEARQAEPQQTQMTAVTSKLNEKQQFESTPRPRAESQPISDKPLPSSLFGRPSSLNVSKEWIQYRDSSKKEIVDDGTSPEASVKDTSSSEIDDDDYAAIAAGKRWGVSSKSPSSTSRSDADGNDDDDEYEDMDEEADNTQPVSLFERAKSFFRPSVLDTKVSTPVTSAVQDTAAQQGKVKQSTASKTPIGATAKPVKRRVRKLDSPLSPSMQVPAGELLVHHRPRRAAAAKQVDYRETRQDPIKWNKKRKEKRKAKAAEDEEDDDVFD
jgi:hypothetical protein